MFLLCFLLSSINRSFAFPITTQANFCSSQAKSRVSRIDHVKVKSDDDQVSTYITLLCPELVLTNDIPFAKTPDKELKISAENVKD
ncbi:hypothetical protein WN943_014827 [Citrus x changshan-huyou]